MSSHKCNLPVMGTRKTLNSRIPALSKTSTDQSPSDRGIFRDRTILRVQARGQDRSPLELKRSLSHVEVSSTKLSISSFDRPLTANKDDSDIPYCTKAQSAIIKPSTIKKSKPLTLDEVKSRIRSMHAEIDVLQQGLPDLCAKIDCNGTLEPLKHLVTENVEISNKCLQLTKQIIVEYQNGKVHATSMAFQKQIASIEMQIFKLQMDRTIQMKNVVEGLTRNQPSRSNMELCELCLEKDVQIQVLHTEIENCRSEDSARMSEIEHQRLDLLAKTSDIAKLTNDLHQQSLANEKITQQCDGFQSKVELCVTEKLQIQSEYEQQFRNLSAELNTERSQNARMAAMLSTSEDYVQQLKNASQEVLRSGDEQQQTNVRDREALHETIGTLTRENHRLQEELTAAAMQHTRHKQSADCEMYALKETIADLQYRLEISTETASNRPEEDDTDRSSSSGELAMVNGDVTLIQQSELQSLHDELKSSQHSANELRCSLSVHQQLLRIRSELIGTMQSQEDSVRQQLANAQELAGSRAEELQQLMVAARSRELIVERQANSIAELEKERDGNGKLQVQVEERMSRLIDENDRLQLQFQKIFNCRHLTE